MAKYIQYIAHKKESTDLKVIKKEKAKQYRKEHFYPIGGHNRAPDNFAKALVCYESFLQFLLHEKVINEHLYTKLEVQAINTLKELCSDQKQFTTVEDPVTIFTETITESLASGKAHLRCAKHELTPKDAQKWGWKPSTNGFDSGDMKAFGDFIGWVSDDEIMLSPESTISHIKKIQGSKFNITKQMLASQLSQDKVILTQVQTGEQRNIIRRTINGHRKGCFIIPNINHFECQGEAENPQTPHINNRD